MSDKTEDLKGLLSRIDAAASERPELSLSAILDAVGRRSFGPILLVAGLVILAPIIGDIPGVPTTVGVFVFLTVGQILLGRERIWLPQWMLKRSVSRARVKKFLGWVKRPARFLDRLTRPRLEVLTRPPGAQVLAVTALLVALGMPAMEVVPFSANAAGLILTLLGLALIASDGLLALVALAVTGGVAVLVAVVLL